MTKELPLPELLRKLLRYEPDTGLLFWRERTPDMFSSDTKIQRDRYCKTWNKRYSGKIAFAANDGAGYKQGRVMDIQLRAHRVIWALVNGVWPIEIDHINGIKHDNRLANLRNVDRITNSMNAPVRKTSKSGITGVSYCNREKLWRAYISVDKSLKSLGYYTSKETASLARKKAEIKYGYHINHGRR